MKKLFALFVVFLATPAIAHPGHVAPLDGHTHSYFELAQFGLTLAMVLGVALFIFARVTQK